MEFVFAVKVSEFENETKKRITLKDRDLLIIRFENNFYAVDNTCPHMGGSLYDGVLEDHCVTCPRHGSVFDVTSGQLHNPGKFLGFNVKPKPLNGYPVKVSGEDLLVGLA